MKVSKIEINSKTITLPYPVYLDEAELGNAEIIIEKISKYDWPQKRQTEYNSLCNQIREFLND